MKVCFFTHYPDLLGANKSLLILIEGLSQKKVSVHIIVPAYGDFVVELEKRNISYSIFKTYKLFSPNKPVLRILGSLKFVINIFVLLPLFLFKFRNERFDLYYSNSSMEGFGFLVSYATKRSHIWHVREFLQLHYDLKPVIGDYLFKQALSKSNALITISDSLKKNLLRDIDAPKYTIYNGAISAMELRKNKPKPLPSRTIQIGIVGVLQPKKRVDSAIYACADFIKLYGTDIHLNIFGSTRNRTYSQYILDLTAKELDKEKFTFHGHVKNEDEIYSSLDIVLVCSEHEGLGRVTMEAMARGIPVIGRNSGGTSEVINDGYSGYLFNTDKEIPELMYNALSPENYVTLSKGALSTVSKMFTYEEYCNKVYSTIDEVVPH